MKIYTNKSADYLVTKQIAYAWWKALSIVGGGDFWKGRQAILQDLDKTMSIIEDNDSEIRSFCKKHQLRAIESIIPTSYAEAFGAIMGSGNGPTLAMHLIAGCLHNGLPVIEVSHGLASSFMLSKAPASVLMDMKRPFDNFTIKVPNGLLLDNGGGEIKEIIFGKYITRESRLKTHDSVGFTTLSSSGSGLWNLQSNNAILLSDDQKNSSLPDVSGVLDFELDTYDGRLLSMIRRLITGVCLYLEGGNSEHTVKHITGGRNIRDNRFGPPEDRIIRLTRPVERVFSEEVREYIAGNGKKINLQYMVMGHWRNQACGVGLKDRKRIFIEAHWKGPEAGAIASRSHRI